MTIFSLILIVISVAVIATAVTQFFLNHQDRLTRRLVKLTAALILSILAIEGAFACQSGHFDLSRTILTDIMQAFSLDADYEAVVARPWNAYGSVWFRVFLSGYSLLLYTLAPILGGAVVYDVLAGVSPAVRLAFCRNKELYIFSELNERAVLLAESISEQKARKRDYALIFTDTYINREGEEENELLLRAKALGAICLQDDILNCPGLRSGKRSYYFLMDVTSNGFDDSKNLITLFHILPLSDTEYLWNPNVGCSIYFFSDSSEAIENVRIIKNKFDDNTSKRRPKKIAQSEQKKGNGEKGGTVKEWVRVSVIRDYALTAGMHLREEPLYRALGEPQQGNIRPLRVAIFGNTLFARELFKTVFWMGQLLDVQLHITVIYPSDSERQNDSSSFERYLDQLCPEIIQSCTSDKKEECLRIWPGEDCFAPPYAKLSFIEANMKSETLRSFLDCGDRVYVHTLGEKYRLADYDIFYVAGSSDSENAEFANELCCALAYLRAKSKCKGQPRQFIDVLIQNDALSQIMESRFVEVCARLHKAYGSEQPEMHPFGSLKERYSYKSVFSSEEELSKSGSASREQKVEHGSADSSLTNDIYSSWSNIGRNLHLSYKMYCAGIKESRDRKDKLQYIGCALDYRRALESDQKLFARLTWLEHRRWNAFLRTQGFTKPPISLKQLEETFGPVMPALLETQTNEQAREVLESVSPSEPLFSPKKSGLGFNLPRINAYKDIQSKIHPCLVESSPEKIQDPDHPDYLDLITAARLYIELIEFFSKDGWRPTKKKDNSKWESMEENWRGIRNDNRMDLKNYDRPRGKALPELDHYDVLCWVYKDDETIQLPPPGDGIEKIWEAFLKTPLGSELSAYEKEKKTGTW